MQEFIALICILYGLRIKCSHLTIIQCFKYYILSIKSKSKYILEFLGLYNTEPNLYAFSISGQIFNNKRSYFSGESLTKTISHRIIKRKGPVTPSATEPTENLKEIIIGLMLGDLSAERYSTNGNTRLRFYFSSINEEYVNHLYLKFKSYVKTPPTQRTRKLSSMTGKIHKDIAFSTLKYSFFNWVIEDFYKKEQVINRNIKILPLNIDKQLTAVSLAY